MITLNVKQGEPEWVMARIGMPTASAFDRVITNKTAQLSSQAPDYICELVYEWMTDASCDSFYSELMERGVELQEAAIHHYEFQRDVDVTPVGFVMLDDRSAGCSPDGLVGDEGGIELKIPKPWKHVAAMLGYDIGLNYRAQVQGCMWITGRKWWDFISYNPAVPMAIYRFERDDEYIEKLAAAVGAFNERLAEAKQEMLKLHPAYFEAKAARRAA